MNCASRAITSLAFGPGSGVNRMGNLASLVIVPTDFSTEVLLRAWYRSHNPDGAERMHLSPGPWISRSKERDQTLIYAEVASPSRKGKCELFTLRNRPGSLAFPADSTVAGVFENYSALGKVATNAIRRR